MERIDRMRERMNEEAQDSIREPQERFYLTEKGENRLTVVKGTKNNGGYNVKQEYTILVGSKVLTVIPKYWGERGASQEKNELGQLIQNLMEAKIGDDITEYIKGY